MTIDPKYICASDLELYLVDKTTGLPLSGGIVTFYSDVNRSILKPVYTISGTAPNYSFVELPNPCILSGVGTFQDEGNNNVVPYYYPYDGDQNLELYYITVESSTNVPQFTREAWPAIAVQVQEGNTTENATNYIPNGQFLFHNDIPADPINDIPFGQITQPVTQIAQGGWNFSRPSDSESIDNIQFFRFDNYVTNPTSSPRYAVQIVNTVSDSGDEYKDLRIRFYDVNKFSSDTNTYTFSFTAKTYNSNNFNVLLNIIKFFGTGGSPTSVNTATEFTITSIGQIFQASIVFGNNEIYDIGTNNDDYVEIALSFPVNFAFGAQLTDFCMFFGDVTVTNFPTTTNRDFSSRSMTLPPIEPDGSNLYLPVRVGREGLLYDSSEIGNIIADQSANIFSGSLSPTTNLMKADGSSYLVKGYSPLGIPYSRLFSVFLNNETNFPIFGTGKNFVSTAITNIFLPTTEYGILFSTNIYGNAVYPTDGEIPTGFSFFKICDASDTGYQANGYITNQDYQLYGSSSVFYKATVPGFLNNPSIGTTPFAINNYRNGEGLYQMFYLNILDGLITTNLAGQYFTFSQYPSGNYYVWFTVDGAGTDPTISGFTGIEVDLKSTYMIPDLIYILSNVFSGCQVSEIVFNAANMITPGSYFTFTTPDEKNYLVWYSIDNVGNDPNLFGYYSIPVYLNSSYDASDVARTTKYTLSSVFFAVPNLEGAFLRGTDPNMAWDLDAAQRFTLQSESYQNDVGTFEPDLVVSHNHTYYIASGPQQKPSDTGSSPWTTNSPVLTSSTGGTENRPYNTYVNWLIRY